MIAREIISHFELVIFDRDGVINYAPIHPERYILNPKDLIVNHKTVQLISYLQEKLLKVAVATNQQCLGKGLLNSFEMNLINDKINVNLTKAGGQPLKFYICPHLESDNCSCRKPKSGLLEKIVEDFKVVNKRTVFIGDSESDEQAANKIGIKFIDFRSNSLF
jgi:D-glycero-D-manno-heptose 1,7-bisphosphate phosphatase